MSYLAGQAVLGVSDLVVCIAAAVAAGGFTGTTGKTRANSDRLGLSSILLGVGIAFAMMSSTLLAVALSDLGATSELTTGLGVAAGGAALGIGGAAVAAAAFRIFARRHHPGATVALRHRDGALIVAAAMLSLGLAVSAIGGIAVALAASRNGFDSPSSIAAWLESVRQVGWAAGAGLIATAFTVTRRRHETANSRDTAGARAWTHVQPERRRKAGLGAVLAICVGAAIFGVLSLTGGNGKALPSPGPGVRVSRPGVSVDLSSNAFMIATDRICRSGDLRAARASSRVSNKANGDSAIALEQVVSALRDGVNELNALSGPLSLEDDRDALVRVLEREIVSAQRATNAARVENQSEYESVLAQVPSETRAAQVAGSKLGASDCAPNS